ncbi:MAG: glycoside hydrolase family 99-like domain-containing protein [Betaproteobacteria bacterium]
MNPDPLRLIAFFLTQFHPIAENDAWWGPGFTEWTTATRARPLFPGHYQPHLPADLGFYDLRVAETRRRQMAMARAAGLAGFCYYYYWFSGRRLLERPLEEMFADPASDLPYCLCWANESWTRRWNGSEHEVLMHQRYLPEDDVRFMQDIERFLLDERYIRVDGKPLLMVYRPQQMPHALRSTEAWRAWWRSRGHGELHLVAALTHGNREFATLGFDAGAEFPPHNLQARNINSSLSFFEDFTGTAVAYEEAATSYLDRPQSGPVYRGVFPSWDNTARVKSRSTIFLGGTPANYEFWLRCAVERTRRERRGDQQIVFINAWNEWAEGCHLEPDQRYGSAFLEATQRVKQGRSAAIAFEPQPVAANSEEERGFFKDLGHVLRYHLARRLGHARLFVNRHPRLKSVLLAVAGRFSR